MELRPVPELLSLGRFDVTSPRERFMGSCFFLFLALILRSETVRQREVPPPVTPDDLRLETLGDS